VKKTRDTSERCLEEISNPLRETGHALTRGVAMSILLGGQAVTDAASRRKKIKLKNRE